MVNENLGNRRQRRARANKVAERATTALRANTTKVAVTGVALASAMAVSVAPFTSQAATYIVGAPDWLGVNNVDNDVDTIYNNIVKDREKPATTIVGWGTGGVDLKPTWVNWYNPNLGGLDLDEIDLGSVISGDLSSLLSAMDLGKLMDTSKDQYYSPRQWGQTGTEQVWVDNPAWESAFETALAQVMLEDRNKILAADKIDLEISYTIDEPAWWTEKRTIKILVVNYSASLEDVFGDWYDLEVDGRSLSEPINTKVTIDNPFKDDPDALDEFLETGVYRGSYTVPPIDAMKLLGLTQPSKPSWLPIGNSDWNKLWTALTGGIKPINVGAVDYSFDRTKFNLPGESWEERAAAAVDPSIPLQIRETRPVFGWLPGGWTTNTFGQWVSPTDDITGLENLDLSALLSGDISLDNLTSLAGLSTRDLAYYLSGDLGFLAPLLNWTTYIHNTNLIGFGDGAITAGLAYQKFIDAVKSGEITAGTPQTDGRYIKITTDENGNPVVQEVNFKKGDASLEEIITSYPLPGDLNFPGIPRDNNGNPILPAYEVVKPGGVLDLHLFTLTLLRNPGRANGGLYARFAPLYEAITGVNPISPDSQNVLPEGLEGLDIAKLLLGEGGSPSLDINDLGDLILTMESADGKPMVITIKADVTWQYDLLSDAPVAPSPLAWANSAVAALLVAQLGESLLDVLDGDTSNLPGFVSYVAPDGTFYGTLTTEGLPLLSPVRLLAGAIGQVLDTDINTPIADALEPLLKTLVNVAYDDWERVENADGTISYERTLKEMHTPTLFGTPTMTLAERAQLAGDVISILGAGIGAEITDINGRLLAGAENLLGALGLKLPTVIKEAWEKAVPLAGDAITWVTAEVGKGVSKVLGEGVKVIEPLLPKALREREQQPQLVADNSTAAKALPASASQPEVVAERSIDPVDDTKDAKDTLESVNDKADELAGAGESESTDTGRKTPVRDAVKKAADGLKKAGEDARAAVKKARADVREAVGKAKDRAKKEAPSKKTESSDSSE